VGLPTLVQQASCAVLLAASSALLWPAAPAVAAEVVHPTLVQTIDTSAFAPSSPDPAGIAYMPAQDRFLISDSEVDETSLFQGFNLFTVTRTGSGFGSGSLLPFANKEPSGLGYNQGDGTLYASNDDKDRISRVQPGPDGVHGTPDDTVSAFSTAAFGSTDPEGVEFDAATGRVFVCDGSGQEIFAVDPVNGTFGDANDAVTHFDLAQYGVGDCEGLGLDPSRNALLAVDLTTGAIYELSMSGEHLRTFDLSAILTPNTHIAGITTAPSSDPGDSPAATSYWIVDRHVDNKDDPGENDGLLYELSLDEPPPPPLVNLPISAGANDADETQTGTIHRSTGDIELGTGSGSVPATAGLRFTGVQIPKGATIVNAQVQFTVDEIGKKAAELSLRAEEADNSPPITTSPFNISSRPRTTASVGWSVPKWQTLGAAGPNQMTPNLATVLQEVVSRPGWAPGNALSVIVTGTGRRTAGSFESAAPPVLRVEYLAP
jgi:hypothetical protein